MNVKIAAALLLAHISLTLLGCGSSEPTDYAAVHERVVVAVWDAADRKAPLEILKRWTVHSAPTAPEAARHSAEETAQLMPASGAVKGWERADEPKPYTPETIEWKNKLEAERLIDFDFQSGLYCDYLNPRIDPRPLLRCVLMDMGTPTNAFAYYSSRRIPDADAELFGSGGFSEAMRAVFWEDRFCVEVEIYSYGTETFEALSQFSYYIDGRLRGSGIKPEPLKSLPPLTMRARTARWFQTDAQMMKYASPAHPGLEAFQGAARGFTAWLHFDNEDGEKAPVLWAEYHTEEEARKAFDAFKKSRGGTALKLKIDNLEAFEARGGQVASGEVERG